MSIITVITHFNRSNLVRSTVESVFSNTLLPDKVFIYDDFSSEEHYDFLLKLSKVFDFTIIRGPKNIGIVDVRHFVIQNIVLEFKPLFFHFLDDDDIISPEFYKQATSLALNSPSKNALFSMPYCSFGDQNNLNFQSFTFLGKNKVDYLKLGSPSRVIWYIPRYSELIIHKNKCDIPMHEDWILYGNLNSFDFYRIEGLPLVGYRRSNGLNMSSKYSSLKDLAKVLGTLFRRDKRFFYLIFSIIKAELGKFYNNARYIN